VPTHNTAEVIKDCFYDAYKTGMEMMSSGACDGFNIGMNMGNAAGQTVMYPHVHLIPRYTGDVADPRGGVRNVIPDKGNYLGNKS
jgi:diadenosine tetraphosphate (Ap4A) HIT family hydrolase